MPLVLDLTAPGDYTLQDDGIPGNFTSVVVDGSGAVIATFSHPPDSIIVNAGAGVTIKVNLTDSLGLINFTVGDPSDPAHCPDAIVVQKISTEGTVTLAASGSITEGGSDASADIEAGTLILKAGSGIGTAGNAIETRTGAMEAETGTGGINLSNVGAVTLGGLSADVAGLAATAGGDVKFTNIGSIALNETTGLASVAAGGASANVRLTARGLDADITSHVDFVAIDAGGDITLKAGRDVNLGSVGSNFDQDVRAGGGIAVDAGRDFILDGASDLLSGQFSRGTEEGIAIDAGRHIMLLTGYGDGAGIVAGDPAGGDVVLATGVGGSVMLTTTGSMAVGSTGGNVVVATDTIVINSASGISAVNGSVTLRTSTPGRDIILGTGGDGAFALALSDAELDRILTDRLIIGGEATGRIELYGNVSLSPQEVILRSGSDIVLGADLTVANVLALHADNIYQIFGSIFADAFTAAIDTAGSDGSPGGSGIFRGLVSGGSAQVSGGDRGDVLQGTAASESLLGLGGADTLRGGEGNDSIAGGRGGDLLDGGGGTDRAQYGDATAAVVADLQNAAMNTGFAAGDSYIAVEDLSGSRFNDSLRGDAAVNTLRGVSGNDKLFGRGGKDTLEGGSGNDILTGGAGNDSLVGGAGADRFVFETALGAGNIDRIADFSVADDVIRLDRSIFTALGAGPLAAGAFRMGTAAADANDRIIYNAANGALLYDADGSGAGAAVRLAVATTGLPLTSADFVIF